MKFRLPSILTQIVIVVLLILLSSVFFYRYFFMESFKQYISQVDSLQFEERINDIYQNYKDGINPDLSDSFYLDLEGILKNESSRKIVSNQFEKDIALYSVFILIFIILLMFLFSFLSLKAITHPLERLQRATKKLSTGNLRVQVRESRYSPLNGLIISFNNMVKELVGVRDKLIQAEKDSVWKDMARVLAHEVKNPLTPILLSIERMEYKFFQSPAELVKIFSESAAVIKEEVSNLKQLSAEFSQFAKIPQPQWSEFKLIPFINELAAPYFTQAKIKKELDENLNIIRADKFQLKQVLVNLLQNAIQACDKDPQIKIVAGICQDKCFIEIIDNGKGIHKEELKKIFEPYFTKRAEGTGLGLAIVNRILNQHDGSISVNSKVGEGSIFRIELPYSSALYNNRRINNL